MQPENNRQDEWTNRESIHFASGVWIPAFAGMTALPMTSVREKSHRSPGYLHQGAHPRGLPVVSQWVIDASLPLQWFLEDESERDYSLAILARLEDNQAV
jgi:hypothetical protein